MEMLVLTIVHVCVLEILRSLWLFESGIRILESLDHDLETLKVRFVIFEFKGYDLWFLSALTLLHVVLVP